MSSTYTVQVFRDGGFWILEVPELCAVGQARTLASAGGTARELVALWLDVPADQVQVVLDYSRIDPEAIELAAGARSEQARAEELIDAHGPHSVPDDAAGSRPPAGYLPPARPALRDPEPPVPPLIASSCPSLRVKFGSRRTGTPTLRGSSSA
ncbi:MAG: hypothetical protein ACRDQ4_17425 [Pseudonocardiaceae bacterium]